MFSDGAHLYQPRITRLPSLLSLLTITLALIALIEIACRRLPARGSDYVGSPINLKLARNLESQFVVRNVLLRPRNDSISSVAISSTDGSASWTGDEELTPTPTQPASATSLSTENNGPRTETAIHSNYMPVVSDTSVPTASEIQSPSAAVSSDYLDITELLFTASSDYLQVKTDSATDSVKQISSSDYLHVTTDSAVGGDLSYPLSPSKSAFLPVHSVIPSTTTAAAAPPNFLSVIPSESPPTASPTTIPLDGSPTSSDYLAISSDSVPRPTPSLTNFLPVVPVDPSITPPIIYSTANPSDYLPVNPSPNSITTATVAPSDDLPVNPSPDSTTTAAVAPSGYLPVNPSPHSTSVFAVPPSGFLGVSSPVTPPTIYLSASPSDYLPVKQASGSPSSPSLVYLPEPSDYLPISLDGTSGDKNPGSSVASEHLPYVLTKSLFLPVGSDPAVTSLSQLAFIPISSHQPITNDLPPDLGLASTSFLPISQNAKSKTLEKPGAVSFEPTPPPGLVNNLPPKTTDPAGSAVYLPQTGIFQGESYSLGTNGEIVIGGKRLSTDSPTTATLANGKVFIIGSDGALIRGNPDPTLHGEIVQSAKIPLTGTFQGESYVLKSGNIIIGGKTLGIASPTTATLANGKVFVIGSDGALIRGNTDPTIPGEIVQSAKIPLTGTFQGESYFLKPGNIIIGGKTLGIASPTTATLSDGRVIILGSKGASFKDAPDVTLPLGLPKPPPRTGIIQGEPYSFEPKGIVVIGGKSFTLASPTTATLPDGNIVIAGPSGIWVQDGHPKAIPESVTLPPQTGVFKGETYSVGPHGTIFIGGKSIETASPTTATLSDGKIVMVGPSGVSVQDPPNSTESLRTYVTPYEYVIGGILPTLIAVIFSIPWNLLALAVKEIQPFYQLQHPDGATAQDSICLDYSYSLNAISTFTAMRKGHHLVWWSGLISMAILFVAPLATGTVFIGFTGLCTATSGRDNCFPKLSVYPVAARILQGILGFIAIFTFALAIGILRKRSGVYANPLSVAALATLFQNPQVIEDFCRLNPYYTDAKMIRAALRENRYQIGSYQDSEGNKDYGLIKIHDDHALIDPNYQVSFRKGQKYASVSVNSVDDHQRLKKNISLSSLLIHPVAVIIFAIFVAGLEVLVIYYNRTGGDTGFERWMDSQSFGVGFLFTAVGVVLKMYWTVLDESTRNMEPYRQLLAGGAKAGDSILLAPHSNPYTGIFYSLRNHHFFNAYLSLVAILCEPLIIALANIPFKAESVFTTYRVSTYISIGVLSLMLIGIIWMFCRKRTPELIRRPDTIASVLLYLCGSNMLEDFKGMARLRRKQRDKEVRSWDKNYAMGRVVGVDEVEREGIDESVFVNVHVKDG